MHVEKGFAAFLEAAFWRSVMAKKSLLSIALLFLCSTFLFAESLAFSYVTEKYEKPVSSVNVFFTDNDSPDQIDSGYSTATIATDDLKKDGDNYVLNKDYLYYLVFKGAYAENILLEFKPMTNETNGNQFLEYKVRVDEVYPSENKQKIDEIRVKESPENLFVSGPFSTNSEDEKTYIYGFNYKFPVTSGSNDDLLSTSVGTYVSEVKVTVNGGA